MTIKILVVDDEHSIADSVVEIIHGAGYEAMAAYSGADALAKVPEFCPNILLTDVLMPGQNGFDLALEVKRLCPDARLLLFSGQASTAQQQLASGGIPYATQLSITTGFPALALTTYDAGFYLQDDWRARPNLTLSYGLRFETQKIEAARIGNFRSSNRILLVIVVSTPAGFRRV